MVPPQRLAIAVGRSADQPQMPGATISTSGPTTQSQTPETQSGRLRLAKLLNCATSPKRDKMALLDPKRNFSCQTLVQRSM
jgi:hypothetical protein